MTVSVVTDKGKWAYRVSLTILLTDSLVGFKR